MRKTNFPSISELLSAIVTFLKENFSGNSPQNVPKKQRSIVLQYVAHFEEKNFFVNICPLLLVDQKRLFKQIQIFLMFCPFSNLLGKTNFLSISVLLSEIVNFLTKK